MRPGGETVLDEASYMAGDLRVPIIVRTPLSAGVSFADVNLILFGANDLSDEADVAARPSRSDRRRRRSCPISATLRSATTWSMSSTVLRNTRPEGNCAGWALRRIHDSEFAEAAKLYVRSRGWT